MGFKRFSLFLFARFILLLFNAITIVLLLSYSGYHAATLLTFLILAAQLVEMLAFISKTNAELTRFFNALRHEDFSQRFEMTYGTGFDELGSAFTDILQRFQSVRATEAEELSRLKAVVEHVPVPLLSIHSDGRLTQWNIGVRRMFGAHNVSCSLDLLQFGDDFSHHVMSIKPGERRLTNFSVDGMEQQLALSATQIVLSGKHEILVSMQNIQSELDTAQLRAWQDLVRVLTHEIMNSVTPVTSLAETAMDLVEDAKQKTMNNTNDGVVENAELLEVLSDVSDAVTTVARRSSGLSNFVNSYRLLTHLPSANRRKTKIHHLFQHIESLVNHRFQKKSITLNTNISPPQLALNVDANMLEQVLINLLKNAEQALQHTIHPCVYMTAYLNPRGHVVISVTDNGKGIDDDIADKIFVPFFTTKHDGSGVGLALTRQVMIAHGGSVKLVNSEQGGAQFHLTF